MHRCDVTRLNFLLKQRQIHSQGNGHESLSGIDDLSKNILSKIKRVKKQTHIRFLNIKPVKIKRLCVKSESKLMEDNYENLSYQMSFDRRVRRTSIYDENSSDMMQISGNILYNLVSIHCQMCRTYIESLRE